MDLEDRDAEEVLAALDLATQDDDPEVREIALEIMEDMDQPMPVELLADMALSDPSPELRMDALDLLVDSDQEAAQAYLEQAVQDSDADVNERAQELLEDIQESLED